MTEAIEKALEPSEEEWEAARLALIKTLQDVGCWERQVRHCAVHDFRTAVIAALRAAALVRIGREE